MLDSILVQDVMEVYLKDLSDDSAYFFGLTTRNEVTQKLKQEILRAGIGNGVVGVIQSDKELSFKATTLLHNDSIISIQSGVKSTNGTYTVQKTEKVKLDTGKLTITGTPTGTTCIYIDAVGKVATGTIATSQITVADGVEGAFYTVVYPSEVTGDILSIDATKFPHNFYVELHTIGYNPANNTVNCDLFWIFNQCLPDGGLSQVFEAGKQNGDEVTFTAQLPVGSDEYGKYIVVPRA